jgi:hypothetical protein
MIAVAGELRPQICSKEKVKQTGLALTRGLHDKY